MGGVALVLGHIAGYILRPNIGLRTLISRIQAEMDFESWKHRSIGVHLRLGDKRSELKILKIPQVVLPYFERIRSLRFIHGYQDVFIASDLASASLSLRRLLEAENFRVHEVPEKYFEMVNNDPLSSHAAHLKHLEFRLGETSPYDEGLTLLAQAWMLSRCDALLGSFTSNYFQLVYELSHVNTTSRVLVEDINHLPYFPCSAWNQVPWGCQSI
jgi:hypothetical protein